MAINMADEVKSFLSSTQTQGATSLSGSGAGGSTSGGAGGTSGSEATVAGAIAGSQSGVAPGASTNSAVAAANRAAAAAGASSTSSAGGSAAAAAALSASNSSSTKSKLKKDVALVHGPDFSKYNFELNETISFARYGLDTKNCGSLSLDGLRNSVRMPKISFPRFNLPGIDLPGGGLPGFDYNLVGFKKIKGMFGGLGSGLDFPDFPGMPDFSGFERDKFNLGKLKGFGDMFDCVNLKKLDPYSKNLKYKSGFGKLNDINCNNPFGDISGNGIQTGMLQSMMEATLCSLDGDDATASVGADMATINADSLLSDAKKKEMLKAAGKALLSGKFDLNTAKDIITGDDDTSVIASAMKTMGLPGGEAFGVSADAKKSSDKESAISYAKQLDSKLGLTTTKSGNQSSVANLAGVASKDNQNSKSGLSDVADPLSGSQDLSLFDKVKALGSSAATPALGGLF